jgi:tRNA pseudouridine55 synthase
VIDGGLLLDKPAGLSSNVALQRARRTLGASKAGHAGTLDPLATGLLVLLFGEATKFAGPLLEGDKEYLATLKLGERTSTGDAEGEVIQVETVPSLANLAHVLLRFKGEISQTPPMHSALKRDGVPLYRLARRGETVERSARKITISALDVVACESPRLVLRVRCSKGTYIRTLAEDIGTALGTVAHLAALRRTASGAFRVEDAVALENVSRQAVLPLATLLQGMPRAELDAAAAARLRNGQALKISGLEEGVCAVFGTDGAVIGLAQVGHEGLRAKRLININKS